MYEGWSESNASVRKWCDPEVEFAIGYGMVTIVDLFFFLVQIDDLLSKNIKRQGVIEFLTKATKTLSSIHWQLLAFMVKIM